MVGGVKIMDADKIMQVVSEGGGTPALRLAMNFVSIRPNKNGDM